jgi:hypothetical protein
MFMAGGVKRNLAILGVFNNGIKKRRFFLPEWNNIFHIRLPRKK